MNRNCNPVAAYAGTNTIGIIGSKCIDQFVINIYIGIMMDKIETQAAFTTVDGIKRPLINGLFADWRIGSC